MRGYEKVLSVFDNSDVDAALRRYNDKPTSFAPTPAEFRKLCQAAMHESAQAAVEEFKLAHGGVDRHTAMEVVKVLGMSEQHPCWKHYARERKFSEKDLRRTGRDLHELARELGLTDWIHDGRSAPYQSADPDEPFWPTTASVLAFMLALSVYGNAWLIVRAWRAGAGVEVASEAPRGEVDYTGALVALAARHPDFSYTRKD
jgi:hypothetical protein